MMRKRDENIVKVAIRYKHFNPLLKEMKKKDPLDVLIKELCEEWSEAEPELFALKFYEGSKKYITEKNRDQIRDGSFLELKPSPLRTARYLFDVVTQEDNSLISRALEKLSLLSSDAAFATEWIHIKAGEWLMSSIEAESFSGECLAYALKSLLQLLELNVISWEDLSSTLITNLTLTLTKDDAMVLRESLALLEGIFLNSTDKGLEVEECINEHGPTVLSHLHSKDVQVRQNCTALLNVWLQRSKEERKGDLIDAVTSRSSIIYDKIMGRQGMDDLGSEMAHQLYVLQSLMLNSLEQRMTTPLDIHNQENIGLIEDLATIVFKNDSDSLSRRNKDKKNRNIQLYTKMGFQSETPEMEFQGTPPGVLALENIVYYARTYQTEYIKLISANANVDDQRRFLFGRSSIELTNLLCDVLNIGKAPSEEGEWVLPMFFSASRDFMSKLFCVCIVLAENTWKEMNATVEDFPKVFLVVKEQITRALNEKPATLPAFKDSLRDLTYSHILEIRKDKMANEEMAEWKAKPIMELKEKMMPEIKGLVRQQRLGYLVDGTRFNRYNDKGQRVKNAFTYWKLSPNHRELQYGDCNEMGASHTVLPNIIPVPDLQQLLIGTNCPQIKDGKAKKISPSLAFTIAYDRDGELKYELFVASDQQTFDYWTDAVNALLQNEMTSQSAKQELETLLNMEIKLRLLDLEGIEIPLEPPPIPQLPPPLPEQLSSF